MQGPPPPPGGGCRSQPAGSALQTGRHGVGGSRGGPGGVSAAFTIIMRTPSGPLLNCAKLIWRSSHVLYANAVVLSTQGASGEAGGG